MNETLEYLKSFAQFPLALRRYLRPGLTVEGAREIVQRRMEERDDRFVALVERSIRIWRCSDWLAANRVTCARW
jgi:hypothetical protein